jgi:hypothetical protein
VDGTLTRISQPVGHPGNGGGGGGGRVTGVNGRISRVAQAFLAASQAAFRWATSSGVQGCADDVRIWADQ